MREDMFSTPIYLETTLVLNFRTSEKGWPFLRWLFRAKGVRAEKVHITITIPIKYNNARTPINLCFDTENSKQRVMQYVSLYCSH